VCLAFSGAQREARVRIPSWCKSYTAMKNGIPIDSAVKAGYLPVALTDGDTLELRFEMLPRRIYANPKIRANRGKVALSYGPFVFCMEGVDNGGDLGEVALTDGPITVGFDTALGLPTLSSPAVRRTMRSLYAEEFECKPFVAKLIPYFAFANRGESDMRIWHDRA